MKVIFLGKPMSGKGTMAKIVSKDLGYAHISTGDLLRNEVKKQTALGQQVESVMKQGELVSDQIIIELLRNNLPEDNYILDGFPRTLPQAVALDKVVKIDTVIDISVNDATIEKRCTHRRSCTQCGKIYGLDVPPQVEEQCDECKMELFRRKDDNLETIRARLQEYQKKTQPLEKYYTEKGILQKIVGEQKIPVIAEQIKSVIESVK
jgi:adenylate kinase